jgi:hypothetical protein
MNLVVSDWLPEAGIYQSLWVDRECKPITLIMARKLLKLTIFSPYLVTQRTGGTGLFKFANVPRIWLLQHVSFARHFRLEMPSS